MRAFVVAALAACLVVGSASAQAAMTLDSFVTRANRIPLNATAALHPDAYRLRSEGERALRAVLNEIVSARADSRTPPACPPSRINVDVSEVLAYLNAIPQARRQRMSVTDGIRSWMGSRYPCPG